MTETTVTMTELRQHLGEYVNRVAYGDERLVLLSHGQPKVVILSYEQFSNLENRANMPQEDAWGESLAAATALRERLQERYKAEGIKDDDAVEILRRLHEE